MPDMRAALYDRYGPPDVLYEGAIPVPTPGPDQLLVRVVAATVNGGELIVRAGRLPRWFLRSPFPRQLGLDFVGDVVHVGDSASGGYAVGDRVWGVLDEKPDDSGQSLRSMAEFVAVHPWQISRAPEGLAPEQAVTMLVGGLTALVALRREAELRTGETLLVRGAGGGVGSMVVQMGKAFGADVTTLAGASSRDHLARIGADHRYDYRTTDPRTIGRFDVVVDAVGTDLHTYRALLGPRGRMVALRFDTDHIARSVIGIGASAVHGRRRIRFFRAAPDPLLLAELARRAEDGTIGPIVDTVYPLSRIGEAHRHLERGGVQGKIVITI